MRRKSKKEMKEQDEKNRRKEGRDGEKDGISGGFCDQNFPASFP